MSSQTLGLGRGLLYVLEMHEDGLARSHAELLIGIDRLHNIFIDPGSQIVVGRIDVGTVELDRLFAQVREAVLSPFHLAVGEVIAGQLQRHISRDSLLSRSLFCCCLSITWLSTKITLAAFWATMLSKLSVASGLNTGALLNLQIRSDCVSFDLRVYYEELTWNRPKRTQELGLRSQSAPPESGRRLPTTTS